MMTLHDGTAHAARGARVSSAAYATDFAETMIYRHHSRRRHDERATGDHH